MALAALFEAIHDENAAARHLREALSRKQLYAACRCSAVAPLRVLAFVAPGGTPANAPLGFAIDPARIALHAHYLVASVLASELPPHDVIFCAMEELESSSLAIEAGIQFASGASKPLLNDPMHLRKLRRSVLPQTLAGSGVSVPPALRCSRHRLIELEESAPFTQTLRFPLLIRPVDTHRGDGLERVASVAEIKQYLCRYADCHFNLTPFIDYRSADGYYRKYRVIVIDGKPHAYHLAISGLWKVHYVTSEMRQHSWMREEEERFLADPNSVFGDWEAVFGAVAQAIGLDYFGVDCAKLDDGSILVFEAGPGMVVHCRDPIDVFPYKQRYVPRIFEAIRVMFEGRALRLRNTQA